VMGPPLTGSSHPIGLTFRTGFRPTGLYQSFLRTARETALGLIG
jgi:hypothetical protein